MKVELYRLFKRKKTYCKFDIKIAFNRPSKLVFRVTRSFCM